MLKVPDAVERSIFSSEAITQAFLGGYLNFAAFARNIRPQIEAVTKKSVKVGTIIVALSRLHNQKETKKRSKFLMNPTIRLHDIVAKLSLREVTYERTEKIEALIDKKVKRNDYLVMMRGVGEITFITEQTAKLFKLGGIKPKVCLEDLSMITVRFGPEYLEEPNTVFVFLRALALQFINVIEVYSTFTEISFVIRQKELNTAIDVFNQFTRSE